MIRATTTSVDETRALAGALAELARPGDLVVLSGDLGAGKTAFAQGFGAGLGVTTGITSPTYTLHNRYAGRLQLDHVDVYRLEQLDEVFDIGLPELLDEGGVLLIEWGETITPALPADYLRVRLDFGDDDDDERTLVLEAVGRSWGARCRTIATALGRWCPEPGPC